MPNWCNNDLIVRHKDRAKIEALADAFAAEGLFDFVKPMPKHLLEKNVVFPAEGGDGQDWYHWRCNNWSTKWEAKPTTEAKINLDDAAAELSISFVTAWSPPIGVYEELCRQGCEICAYYIEEGVGFVGRCSGDADSFSDIECDIEGQIDEDVANHWAYEISEYQKLMAEMETDE